MKNYSYSFTIILLSFFLLTVFYAPCFAQELQKNELSTTLQLSISPDTEIQKPELVSAQPQINSTKTKITLRNEPNATIQIFKENNKLLTTSKTNTNGLAETFIDLPLGTNTLTLIATDYWGNISKPTIAWIEVTIDMIIISQEKPSFSLAPKPSLSNKVTEKEIQYTITPNSLLATSKKLKTYPFTVNESDFFNDSDQDQITDALEIAEGKDPYSYNDFFQPPVDVLNFDKAIITNGYFFLYGIAPKNQSIKVQLENILGQRFLIWSGKADEAGTFLLNVPFEQIGNFAVIIQIFDNQGKILNETNKGIVTFSRAKNSTPLEVNAFYKVITPIPYTSILSLNDYAKLSATTLFGPDIDLTFSGKTQPLAEIFILWKGKQEWYLQAISHPNSGSFDLKAPSKIPSGDYAIYIYSQDLKTNIVSSLIKANFTIVARDNATSKIDLNLNQILMMAFVISGLFLVLFKMHRFYLKRALKP
ncbi:MAG: hypothetical protein UT55_C0039G0005 [Candidatus Peregrinibacteria bacterium GW2011_GWE2_39_6]|nr:MAG: hypothetical protein UT36_C0006G0084 [Candidatus Peregrinibacteria bacterium GW2011_GWF2_39_17]KKR25534.1 MAG: hypothetical protein UT55_C0039G0005 [Candidatus Peregrinibacteria bacterium GW2011_GWE2_39_6]HCW32756.1 hypothetical protein [Candidatus Peregrinibacteria bacterium]